MHLVPDVCRALIDASADPALVIDEHDRIIAANMPAERAARRALPEGADAASAVAAMLPVRGETDEDALLLAKDIISGDSADAGIVVTALPGLAARLVRMRSTAPDPATFRRKDLSELLHHSEDGLLIFNTTGSLITMNRSVSRLLSLPLCPEELAGHPASHVLDEIAFCLVDPVGFTRTMAAATHTPEREIETVVERYDGVRLSVSARPFVDDETGAASIWIITPAPGASQPEPYAADAVCSSELGRIIENSPAKTVLVHRGTGRITAANAAARTVLEPYHGTLTGSVFPTLFATENDERFCRARLLEASVDAVSFTGTLRTGTKSAPDTASALISCHPVVALSGILLYCSISTAQGGGNAEVPSSEVQEAASLIGAIAHQWRQPLATLSLLMQDIEARTSATPAADIARTALSHISFMDATIDDFRRIHGTRRDTAPVNVADAMAHVIDLFAPQCERHAIRIATRASTASGSWSDLHLAANEAPEPFTTTGNGSELRQVFMNLVANARDAIVEHRSVDRDEPFDDHTVSIRVGAEDRVIIVCVEDTGPGIKDDDAHRLFDPFFTTRNEGTGIGLSMSRYIIEQRMGGTIRAENGLRGARFVVTLPRSDVG